MSSGASSAAGRRAIAREVLKRHGETYAHEIGIKLADNTPSALFQWLCAAILFSAPIGAPQAVAGARALKDAGLTTPKKMADTTWDQRRKPLTDNGYARYDEKTATFLGETAQLVEEEWHGDLRRLHDSCEGDADCLRNELKRAKGLGDVGVDIFFREAQEPWQSLRPFADKRARKAAVALGLMDTESGDPGQLADVVSDDDLARLMAGLVRADLAGDADDIINAARGAG
ncbi:endonuclease [Caenispirillum salinarum]|uniref:endonuclease n=1 Tax=Caenispirillum salinarum TaxID=859058 RepID=UPI00384A96C6